jgi:hypothetical protein
MPTLHRDPSPHELLQRIRNLELRADIAESQAIRMMKYIELLNDERDLDQAQFANLKKRAQLAESQANRMMKYIDYLFDQRDTSLQIHQVQYNRIVSVQERLTMLEDKVVPQFGPMLHRLEGVVGEFDEWNILNPLDHRKKDPRKES